MHATLLLVLLLQADGFESRFTGATLRLDTFHSGDAATERVSLDAVRLEGEWPGSRTQLLDTTDLGKYLFEAIDRATNQVVWSRGYASIFGEWETTGEAKRISRTFHESVRFPEPRKPVQFVLKKRDAAGVFRELFSTVVDPKSRFVHRAPPAPRGEVIDLLINGPPATKVDLLFLGDGYAAAEKETFRAQAKALAERLLGTEPFRSRRSDFNVRALFVAAPLSGITDPRAGIWVDSPLSTTFNVFDSDRYVLTLENRTLRDVAAGAPYDHLEILVNTKKYGGGGIFNLYATAAAGSGQAGYLVVHEFGHSFAGLADEYYTSDVAYEDVPADIEPWEPNVTALLDPASLKWRDLVESGTPLPTPWDKEHFDRVSLEYGRKRRELAERGGSDQEAEALMAEVKETTAPMLSGERYAGKVGAFEGAGYRSKGLYRPATDCIMFTRNVDGFCAVCARAITRAIDLLAR
jgi:hypothetical protein